jgi:hypothetical protein
MSQKFETDIDLAGRYHILGQLLETIAGNPGTTPNDGRIWYDSTANTVKVQINGVTVDLRNRGTMNGTQTASTISDFTAAVQAIRWASMVAPNGAVDMNSQQFANLAAATVGGQAVEYAQFQTALAAIQVGMDFKEHAAIAALTNITITAPGATINGRTMIAGDRVLLTAQTTASQNGLWVWNTAASAMTRPADAPTGNTGAVIAGTIVEAFNATNRVLYMQTATGTGTNGAIIVDTDAQTWTNPFPAFVLANGFGTTASGNQVNVNAGLGIVVPASAGSSAAIDTSIVGRKITGVIPTATSGIFTVGSASGGFVPVTINHGLSNVCPIFGLRYGSAGSDPGNTVWADNKPPTVTDANNLTVYLPTGYATNQYQFTLVG